MKPLVGIIMGSSSDWETMQGAAEMLDSLGIAHEVRVISAHRTPDLLFEYAAAARERGLKAIIAGAGGAAHLPGMTAAKTPLPVLGVPIQSKVLNGIDSLLSIAQMPGCLPPRFSPTNTRTSARRWTPIARHKQPRYSPIRIRADLEPIARRHC